MYIYIYILTLCNQLLSYIVLVDTANAIIPSSDLDVANLGPQGQAANDAVRNGLASVIGSTAATYFPIPTFSQLGQNLICRVIGIAVELSTFATEQVGDVAEDAGTDGM